MAVLHRVHVNYISEREASALVRVVIFTVPADDYETAFLLGACDAGYRVTSVAIPTIYADEVSHLKPVRYGMKVLSVVWGYKRGKYRRLVLS